MAGPGCVSVQAVCLGRLSVTLQMLCKSVACACICVFACVGVAGHLHVFVCVPVCACVPVSLGVSVSVPGGGARSVPQPCASVCTPPCLSLCVQPPQTACACISAHMCLFSLRVWEPVPCLCPSAPMDTRCVSPVGVGAPACACVPARPARARRFFGTDTLPPSAQTNSNSRPPALSPEQQAPRGLFLSLPPPSALPSRGTECAGPSPRGLLAGEGGDTAGLGPRS